MNYIREVKALYFSGTGTTETLVRVIADELSKQLAVPAELVNFTTPDSRERIHHFGADELAVVATPVYAGRVPNVLLPYIKEKIHGSGGPAVPLVLFGNRNFDDALIELRDLLESDGFRTIAGAAFVCEHSFSRSFGKGRPDREDIQLARTFAASVAKKLLSMEELPQEPVPVRGNVPVRPYYTPRDRQGNPINILKVKPLTDLEKCTQCGRCVSLCPMGSIEQDDPSKISGICIKCCACVKKCPVGAKYYTDPGYLYHQHELEEGYARRAEPELFL